MLPLVRHPFRAYNFSAMREFQFSRSISEESSHVKFQAEILDLRADILRKMQVLLIVLGWGGMAYSLSYSPARPDWLSAGAFGVVLITGFACMVINLGGHTRRALWVCSLCLWLVALGSYLARPDSFGPVWIGTTSVLATVLVGPVMGWALSGVTIVSVALFHMGQENAPWASLLSFALPQAALVLITHLVSRALFQSLRWMSEGYELAHQQAEQQRHQSAELSAALKSLGQTSFALARANEQLEIMGKFAEDARRSKQEFAASVSHELRTPLNLIIGFSDIILNAPETYNMRRMPPGLLADIHVIHQNAQHLLKLVNDILDLSQMDVAYMTITREPMRLDGFIQSALEDFAQLTQSHGLTLTLRVEPGLPEIYADKTRIRQVLLNLVNNAMRFTETGGITVHAYHQAADPTPETAVHPSAVIISVSDTGVGIASEDLQRIFEPFTKIDRSAKHLGGTGLGLTISKRFVELHGGRMWVESALRKGSTFYFTLPVVPPPPDARTSGTLREVRRQEVGVLAVVERAPLLSRLLEHRLEGIRICHVRNAEELLALSASAPPETILINQPSSAAPVNREFLEHFKNVPVISCCLPDFPVGPGREPAQAEGAEQVIRRYMIKPVTRERLSEVVSEMLGGVEGARSGDAGGPAGPHPNHRPGAATAHILVVEDDEDALHLMGRLLRSLPDDVRQGYDAIIPVEMRSGEQALAYLRSLATPEAGGALTINGILLDLKLDGTSGFDVLDEIDRQPALRGIPVCIVSGQEASGNVLITPYLNVTRQSGLTARELTQAVAALLQLMLPGIEVTAR